MTTDGEKVIGPSSPKTIYQKTEIAVQKVSPFYDPKYGLNLSPSPPSARFVPYSYIKNIQGQFFQTQITIRFHKYILITQIGHHTQLVAFTQFSTARSIYIQQANSNLILLQPNSELKILSQNCTSGSNISSGINYKLSYRQRANITVFKRTVLTPYLL